jgi:hypothetical protein
MRVTITLPQECSTLVRLELGAHYLLYVCPLMFSRAPTVDIEQTRAAAICAYCCLSGEEDAPTQFGLKLQCTSTKDTTFSPVTIVKFDENAQMLSKVPRPKKSVQSNTMWQYLQN